MRCYYAHPVSLYSNHTTGTINHQEVRDLSVLTALGFEVVDPNDPAHDAGYKREGMEYFCNLIVGCDVLAFRAFPDGAIPAGVAKETACAHDLSKPVIELPSGVWRRTLSVDVTREVLREAGVR